MLLTAMAGRVDAHLFSSIPCSKLKASSITIPNSVSDATANSPVVTLVAAMTFLRLSDNMFIRFVDDRELFVWNW